MSERAVVYSAAVPVTAYSASNAYKQVVSLAGYNNVRDAVDLRVISNVVNSNLYQLPHSQSEVGGWPDRAQHLQRSYGHRPDATACRRLLGDLPRDDPYVVNPITTPNADGYTDLAAILSTGSPDLHAVCAQDGFVDVNLRNFTAGMANNAT